MKNRVPNKVRQNLINKITETFNAKENKKYLVILISEEKDGLSTGFLSTYNNDETIGVIERLKITTLEKIRLDEVEKTITNPVQQEEQDVTNLNYVS